MKPRIYTDTSVLGGCEDDEFRVASRRLLEAFEGGELTRLTPHEIARRGIGFVPENRRIFPGLTVRENLDVATTAGLTVDQSVKNCVRDENKAKQQLAGQWSKFPAPSRASCTSQESIGGTPSYVSLQACLQFSQGAR